MENNEPEKVKEEISESIKSFSEAIKEEIRQNNEKKGGNKVFIVLLVLMIIGLGGYIAYDKFIAKDNNENNNCSNVSTNNNAENLKVKSVFFKVMQDNKNIYVNDNLVEFDSELRADLDNSFSQGYISYYDLGNILYVDFGGLGWHNGVFVDVTGKIVNSLGKIVGEDNYHMFSVSKIDENKVYLQKSNLTKQDGSEYCEKLATKSLDDEFARIDLISYLGNGEFKYEKGVQSIAFKDYEYLENCSINYLSDDIISKFSAKYDLTDNRIYKVELVQNSYDYIYDSNDGKLVLLDYDANIIKVLSEDWLDNGATYVKYDNGYIVASVHGYESNESKTLKYNINTGEITE